MGVVGWVLEEVVKVSTLVVAGSYVSAKVEVGKGVDKGLLDKVGCSSSSSMSRLRTPVRAIPVRWSNV